MSVQTSIPRPSAYSETCAKTLYWRVFQHMPHNHESQDWLRDGLVVITFFLCVSKRFRDELLIYSILRQHRRGETILLSSAALASP